jgi:hypothetical protein
MIVEMNERTEVQRYMQTSKVGAVVLLEIYPRILSVSKTGPDQFSVKFQEQASTWRSIDSKCVIFVLGIENQVPNQSKC